MPGTVNLALFAALVVLAVSGLAQDALASVCTAGPNCPTGVPEPGSLVLLATGIGALLFGIWRRKGD
ncbi:MAG: PEP-CTERM sorting domain-containing protein [Alphaproteobacteria bacterium]